MPSALADRLLAVLAVPVVCDHCDVAFYPLHLSSGVHAYANRCGCRLRPVPAAALEDCVRAAVSRRTGVHGDSLMSLLHQYSRRLRQVRVGSLAEEVTCVWQ